MVCARVCVDVCVRAPRVCAGVAMSMYAHKHIQHPCYLTFAFFRPQKSPMPQCTVGDTIKVGKLYGTIKSTLEVGKGTKVSTVARVAYEVRVAAGITAEHEDVVIGGRGTQKFDKVHASHRLPVQPLCPYVAHVRMFSPLDCPFYHHPLLEPS